MNFLLLVSTLPVGLNWLFYFSELIYYIFMHIEIQLPKGMTEDEACKILKKVVNEHWKNDKAIKVEKRNFTDEFSEKPLIPSIGGICYKNYGHKPLG